MTGCLKLPLGDYVTGSTPLPRSCRRKQHFALQQLLQVRHHAAKAAEQSLLQAPGAAGGAGLTALLKAVPSSGHSAPLALTPNSARPHHHSCSPTWFGWRL